MHEEGGGGGGGRGEGEGGGGEGGTLIHFLQVRTL